jgi:acetyl esterase
MLDPDIRRLLDSYFAAPPPPGPPDVPALRVAAEAAPEALGGPREDVASVRDQRAGHARGAVPIRVYEPAIDAPRPLVVFAHGGGWVTGSLDSHDHLCRMLANRIGATVVAVDYRRAPEHRHPAALDDFEAAWHWCVEEARQLHADVSRTVVAGDSSGGHLAAALARRLVFRREALPALQLLLYPALDARTGLPSYDRFAAGVAVRVIDCAGSIHGFLRWSGAVPSVKAWIDTIAAATRVGLG